MTEITKSTEAKKDEMQVEKEKLESVKRADAAVKTMHDFTSPEVLYKELINSVLKYHPSTDISMIEKAYKVASEAHEGQKRKSGEPYIIHPLCVAIILADLELDKETIVAGLLHDAVEDTWMTYEEVEKEFGSEVALLVDGVTKLGQLSYSADKVEVQAENLRKMFLAMAKDIRVILIKLADRLHNMRTLQYMRPEKQQEKARETMDIYAPIAMRLGISKIKVELDDLSLKYLKPDVYYDLVHKVALRKSEREQFVGAIVKEVKKHMDDANIKAQVDGRVKHFFSIYKKMVNQDKTIDQIYDLFAVRILVDTVKDCYAALGVIHEMYKPIPGRFKDYIAMPKPNMYQSLHTTLIGPNGQPFEIQIRTYEMHRTAEYGIAAHWAYKENAGYSPEKEQLEITNKLKWYKDLTTYVENSDYEDPLDSIIEDIFSANVYVFSPRGDVYDFPAGSMPLDFAYRIHSDIGNKTIGAIVNGKIVPLSYKLKTGDVIEIKTSNTCAGPTNAWIKLAKTSHARTKIKGFINKKQRDEIVARGSEEFNTVAKSLGYNPTNLDEKTISTFFSKYNFKTPEDLLWCIGKGELSALAAMNRILGLTDTKLDNETALKQYSESSSNTRKQVAHNGYGIIVEGLDRAKIKLGNCCQPVYGDEIAGYISKGNGIIVHRLSCPNIDKNGSERFINIYWDKESHGKVFDTTLKVSTFDRKNLLADIINILNTCNVTIASVTLNKNRNGECIVKFKLQVANLIDLNNTILNLNKMSEIYDIERIFK